MATKLTKINANKNLSKTTTTFMKTYVTEITIVIITRITEILVRPNNTQALGPWRSFIFLLVLSQLMLSSVWLLAAEKTLTLRKKNKAFMLDPSQLGWASRARTDKWKIIKHTQVLRPKIDTTMCPWDMAQVMFKEVLLSLRQRQRYLVKFYYLVNLRT